MRKTATPALLAPRGGGGDANANTNTNANANIRRLSTASNASSSNEAAGGAVPRYSWHGDVDKTRVLLRLVNDTVVHKPEHQRRVTTSEWEIILDAFNREVSPPAESARVLHNRFSNLRVQCKDYHNVLLAQRRGLLDSVDAWVLFLKVNPALRKWRKKPFELYDEMMESLRLQGEDLDNPPPTLPGDHGEDDDDDGDANAGTISNAISSNNANDANVSNNKPKTKRRRTASPTPTPTPTPPAPRAAANAPGGVVSISHYPAALRHLAALALPLEDRVDAKRFLVADENAQAFIYMDDAERRFFLQKYCFDRRATQRRDAGEGEGGDAETEPTPSALVV